jgi:hypothetical protein
VGPRTNAAVKVSGWVSKPITRSTIWGLVFMLSLLSKLCRRAGNGSGAYMHSGMRSDPHVGALRRCSLTETETDLRNEIYEHLP